MDIEAKVKQIIVDELSVEMSQVTNDAKFIEILVQIHWIQLNS